MIDRKTEIRRVGPEQRQRDVAEGLAPRRAVDRGRLLELARDALQAGEERIMWKPKYFHEMTTNSASRTVLGSASHGWIERAAGRPLSAPSASPPGWSSSCQTTPVMTSERTNGAKNSEPQERAAPEPAVEDQGQPERERELDDERQHDDEDVVLDGAQEDRSPRARS